MKKVSHFMSTTRRFNSPSRQGPSRTTRTRHRCGTTRWRAYYQLEPTTPTSALGTKYRSRTISK